MAVYNRYLVTGNVGSESVHHEVTAVTERNAKRIIGKETDARYGRKVFIEDLKAELVAANVPAPRKSSLSKSYTNSDRSSSNQRKVCPGCGTPYGMLGVREDSPCPICDHPAVA